LDMIMPDMSGPEVYRAMRSIDPNVRVLIASGFSIDKDIQALLDLDRGAAAYIQKPFLRCDLLAAVDRLLHM
jgi:two-component system cell cycle sensor histidine kinase/response regulator CckA